MAKQLEKTPTSVESISHVELDEKFEAFMKSLEEALIGKFKILHEAQKNVKLDNWRGVLVETFLDLFFRDQAGRPDEIAEALENRAEFNEAYEISLRYFKLPPFPANKPS